MVYGMEKTTLYLPAELQQRLRLAARQSGRPQAELVRDALVAFLGEERRPMPSFVGSFPRRPPGLPDGVNSSNVKAWVHSEWDRKWRDRG